MPRVNGCFSFREDVQRLYWPFFVHYLFLFVALILEAIFRGPRISDVVGPILLLVLFRSSYMALKSFYYSFWGLSSITLFISLFCMLKGGGVVENVSYLYFFSFISLLVCWYFLSSPLFYPWRNWWEYDFRYIRELKVKVFQGGAHLEARLIDARRGAVALICFDEIPLGEEFQIIEESAGKRPRVLFLSHRTLEFGRGRLYTGKFLYKDADEKREILQLEKQWRKKAGPGFLI